MARKIHKSVKLLKFRGIKGAVLSVSFLLWCTLFLWNPARCLQRQAKGSFRKLPAWIKPVKKSAVRKSLEMAKNRESVDCAVAGTMTSMPYCWVLKSHEILGSRESLGISYAFILPQQFTRSEESQVSSFSDWRLQVWLRQKEPHLLTRYRLSQQFHSSPSKLTFIEYALHTRLCGKAVSEPASDHADVRHGSLTRACTFHVMPVTFFNLCLVMHMSYHLRYTVSLLMSWST